MTAREAARRWRRKALPSVLNEWWRVFAEKPVTVGQIAAATTHDGDLCRALKAIAGDGGRISTRRLGYWLSQNWGVVVDGRSIEPVGLLNGYQRWRLVTPDPFRVGIMVDTTKGEDARLEPRRSCLKRAGERIMVDTTAGTDTLAKAAESLPRSGA